MTHSNAQAEKPLTLFLADDHKIIRDGVEAVRQLRAAGYRGVIVMLSMRGKRRHISQALDAGVNAYLHKDHAFEQIIAAIDGARVGKSG